MAYTKQRKGRSPLPRKDMEALAKVTYCLGHCIPNYPVPARLIEFDYWPATSTDSGLPAFYGHDHYKPGRWLEFLTIK